MKICGPPELILYSDFDIVKKEKFIKREKRKQLKKLRMRLIEF